MAGGEWLAAAFLFGYERFLFKILDAALIIPVIYDRRSIVFHIYSNCDASAAAAGVINDCIKHDGFFSAVTESSSSSSRGAQSRVLPISRHYGRVCISLDGRWRVVCVSKIA